METHGAYDLALHSLQCSLNYLKGILSGRYTGPHNTYASNIDSGTRFVHVNVWRDLPAKSEVLKNILPLFIAARELIYENDPHEISKHNSGVIRDNMDYLLYSQHVKDTIDLRIRNLERYCKGLPSEIIPRNKRNT